MAKTKVKNPPPAPKGKSKSKSKSPVRKDASPKKVLPAKKAAVAENPVVQPATGASTPFTQVYAPNSEYAQDTPTKQSTLPTTPGGAIKGEKGSWGSAPQWPGPLQPSVPEKGGAFDIFPHASRPLSVDSIATTTAKFPDFRAPSRDEYSRHPSQGHTPETSHRGTPLAARYADSDYEASRTGLEPEVFEYSNNRADYSLLGEDIAWKIFHYVDCVSLARCAQVCKQWNSAASDPALWCHLRLCSGYAYPKAIIKRLVARYGHTMESLVCDNCYRVTDDALEPLVGCSKLYSLQLNNCSQLTDRALSIVSNIPTITELGINGIRLLSHRGLNYLRRLEGLTALSILWNQQFDDKAMEVLAQITSLKFLDMRGLSRVTDEGIEWLFRSNLHTVWHKGSYRVTDMAEHRLSACLHHNMEKHLQAESGRALGAF